MMEEFSRILGLAARFQPPAWVPTRINRKLRASARQIDGLILGIIAERKKSHAQGETPRDDLLSLLIDARDEDGAGMSDTQIRDEAMTLFLAGHETTALVLTYALYLLAHAPRSPGAPRRRGRARAGRPPPDVRGLARAGRDGAGRPGDDAPLPARLGDGAPGADRRRGRRVPVSARAPSSSCRRGSCTATPSCSPIRTRSIPTGGATTWPSGSRGLRTSRSAAGRASASATASR